jgi:hypothetical protein
MRGIINKTQFTHKIPFFQHMQIKGYEWELQLGLTEKAKQNLKVATDFFR